MTGGETTLIAVSIGRPRPLRIGGRIHSSGIFKEPVDGPVRLHREGLDGDVQVDRRVHGGEHRAVYLYPHEHYTGWKRELGLEHLPFGAFGENLTVTGMRETEVHLGDEFEVGTARIQISQPRLPCAKLSARFGVEGFHRRFLASGRIGYYARVLTEGIVRAGEPIRRASLDPEGLTVGDASRLYHVDRDDHAGIERILRVEALTPGWRHEFRRRRDRTDPELG